MTFENGDEKLTSVTCRSSETCDMRPLFRSEMAVMCVLYCHSLYGRYNRQISAYEATNTYVWHFLM